MTGQRDPARLFPAGTAVSYLTVYDWSSPDGVRGGSAHVHLACTEGYVVLRGQGRLQTLSQDGYAETPLTPMTVAWFSPGVIHRLVNDGDLQILVVMQNAGLPEAGDSVLTFPPEHLATAAAYSAVATLPGPPGGPGATGEGDGAAAARVADPAAAGSLADAARRRKNLAVEGFLTLREQVAEGGPGALEDFYASAVALVRDMIPAWRDRWETGPLAAAAATGEQLTRLSKGHADGLRQGRLTVLTPPAGRGYGMCGRLAAYPPYPREA